MKSICFRFVGHDYLLMDLCKAHISTYSFVNCQPIIKPQTFLKSQLVKEADVVLVDLPVDKQGIYEFGIHLKRIFPNSLIVALAHRKDLSRLLRLQHIEKLFEVIVEREAALLDLDKLVTRVKNRFNIKTRVKTALDFTSREIDVITLTCQELKNDEIADKLKISIVGERMQQSFPAFVLANFPVPDAIFPGLVHSNANHEEFVGFMNENLLGENKKTLFLDSPIETTELEGKVLQFKYTSKSDVIEISCSFG